MRITANSFMPVEAKIIIDGKSYTGEEFNRSVEALRAPSLTDDQQVVLDYLKKMCPPELGVSAMVTTYCLVDIFVNDNWQEYPEHIEALQKLSVAEENQVLTAFAEWSRRKSDG